MLEIDAIASVGIGSAFVHIKKSVVRKDTRTMLFRYSVTVSIKPSNTASSNDIVRYNVDSGSRLLAALRHL